MTALEPTLTWRFPQAFWLANFVELCERMAYYGFFIALTLYLTNVVGFNDTQTGYVAGIFFAGIFFLPPFVGALVDRIGFRVGLLLAFALLVVGYTLLGCFHHKVLVLLELAVVMVGGSLVKPLITGTVAKTTTEVNRARAYSLFYWVVNIGSFVGKTVVPWVRQGVGVEYVNFLSAGMSLLALVCVLLFYKPIEHDAKKKNFGAVCKTLLQVLSNPRLLVLTLIVSGFWIQQQQLYASLPKFIIRLMGASSRPEWLANANPLVVVLFVVLITQLMKRFQAVTSVLVGIALVPLSALCMSLAPWLERSVGGGTIRIFGGDIRPLTIMMLIGIAIQGLAESFITPRLYEYFSLQAPKGEEGTYLGFSHLPSFFAALVAFIMSGYLLDRYCPDPRSLPAGLSQAERALRYSQAHYIWYYFATIGAVAALSLLVFVIVTRRIDARNAIRDSA